MLAINSWGSHRVRYRNSDKGTAWQGSPELIGDLAAKAKQLSRQAQLLALWAADDELWDVD